MYDYGVTKWHEPLSTSNICGHEWIDSWLRPNFFDWSIFFC